MTGMTSEAPEASAPFAETARVMRILAEPTRLRVLNLLCDGEMNVTALGKVLGLAQPTVSHHLGLLREEGLLTSRRDGKQIFYAVNPTSVNGRNSSELSVQVGGIKLMLDQPVDLDAQPENHQPACAEQPAESCSCS